VSLTLGSTAICVMYCIQVHEQLLLSMLRVEDVKDRKVTPIT
jgi:hypothetical protein